MKRFSLSPGLILISTLIFFGAIFRLIPHLPNFTPISAIALFGGAYLNRKLFAFIIPLLALFISDAIIGFHNTMFAVYFSFILIVLIGILIKRNLSFFPILFASIASSLLFYIITNFAAWFSNPIYPQNLTGLLSSYIMGLPFLNNGVIGDLFFNSVLFGTYYFVSKKFPVLSRI